MTNLLPKNTDQLDARPNPTHGDSPLSSASVSDAAWLRGNVRSQDARLADDEKFAGYSDGNENDRYLRHARESVEIPEEDWDSLFGAIEEKLESTVKEPLTAATPAQALERASAIRTVVLDCVKSLDTLFKALKQERIAHRQPPE